MDDFERKDEAGVCKAEILIIQFTIEDFEQWLIALFMLELCTCGKDMP